MALKFTTSYLEDSLELFRHYKRLADRAMAQVADEKLFASLGEESNSIAIIVKHMAGNMRSRWTDFLSSDGEKPTRDRDSEFEDPAATREALMRDWESGWAAVLGALEPLTDDDLERTVTIRGEAHSVMQAINRQVAHYAHHIGQIVLLAKHFAAEEWESLTIPRRQSAEFNRRVSAGEASQR
ncbi:MAG TPA: DinB family protein [Terracidiphilus sp.]